MNCSHCGHKIERVKKKESGFSCIFDEENNRYIITKPNGKSFWCSTPITAKEYEKDAKRRAAITACWSPETLAIREMYRKQGWIPLNGSGFLKNLGSLAN